MRGGLIGVAFACWLSAGPAVWALPTPPTVDACDVVIFRETADARAHPVTNTFDARDTPAAAPATQVAAFKDELRQKRTTTGRFGQKSSTRRSQCGRGRRCGR